MTHDLIASMAEKVRAFGARFDANINTATRDIYRPHLDLMQAGEERSNVEYGTHVRHRLDIYQPKGKSHGIVVFVHGGGFIGGDKNSDGAFYVNVGRWLARNGWTCVIPNYRLAPADTWPAGARDLNAVMQWVNENRQSLAAQRGPLVVWGQSAGASHVASWLFDAQARGNGAVEVSAVMLMSGFYQAVAPLTGGPKQYFGDDESLYKLRSPQTHVGSVLMPLWVSVAELDPAVIARQTYALADAVTLAMGHSPDFHFFRGHNHVSTVQSLGSPQEDAGLEILRFLSSVEKR